MKDTFSLGIIGAGMYGKILMRGFAKDPRARLSWVCSSSDATTNAAAAEFSVPNKTTDYRQILADPSVDAVVIATPPYLHREQFEAAVEAGKHVFIEKPLATTLDDAERIVAAAQRHPELVTVEASCRHARLQRKFEFCRDLIASGKLGTIYHINHVALQRTTFVEWNKKGAWGLNKALSGGGPIIDWGEYDLSFHLGILGDTPQLESLHSFTMAGLRDMSRLVPINDVEQHAATWLKFSDGLTYYYERGAGVHGETGCETRIHGTKGGLRLHYLTWESNSVEWFFDDGELRKQVIEVPASSIDDNTAAAFHFLDCLQGKTKPMMTVELAVKHLRILFRILAPA